MQDALAAEIKRVIAQVGVLEDEMGGIDPKTIDAPLQPEAHNIKHGGFDRRIAPVEVWLLLEESVQIILAGGAVPLPGGATHCAQPVVGWRAIGLSVGPYIPVPHRILARTARRKEPGMLVRGMIRDKINNDLEIAPMRLLDQRVARLQIAENGINIAMIGNVVAKVGHW